MIALAVIWTTALLLYHRLELDRELTACRARYRKLLAERALQESRNRYRQLVEATPDGIIVHQDGVIRFVSPGAVSLSGASESKVLIGRPLRELLPETMSKDSRLPLDRSLSRHHLQPGRSNDCSGSTGARWRSRSALCGST